MVSSKIRRGEEKNKKKVYGCNFLTVEKWGWVEVGEQLENVLSCYDSNDIPEGSEVAV